MYRRYEPSDKVKPVPENRPIADNKPPKKCENPPNVKKRHLGSLSSFIPSSVYNPETKKVFGIFSAEDVLIAALILVLNERSEENGDDNTLLICALLYILLSEYIDLPI